ncbi:MAG: branched-chain amino acid ABC transporter permease [Acidimicrobiaceae bacterium]|nr:branched-chain amino acid ABC transporter permease [Acidimicrobiaceae bacterium]MYC43695.1 branched-chain amino acid ABC transporter permease [Acidimicrobiaceae bacterium]MYH88052.1 branched-chain amino acid ABC transporter permease [Acidimicrobiaceae bacterium]
MIELLQNLIDGLGRGSIYALLALGVAVVFGVMHLLNFAHGELITISGYAAYAAGQQGWSWYIIAPLIVVCAVVASLVIERVAFSRVRGESDFTLLLTSFGVHFVVSAAFLLYVSASVKTYPRPGWVTNTYSVGPLNIEVFDTVVIVVTIVTLIATTMLLQRTMFGLALRAASADFDTARLMGVKSDSVIRGAFALSGLLAGIAGVFWLMRSGSTTPSAGIDPMLKGVLAALIGGLGSLRGAVLGGFALGLAEVLLRSRLPDSIASLTEGVVFVLIALLFIFRPQGLITVAHAERV